MRSEELREAGSFDEMRAEIFRLQRIDPMVRNVMDMASYRGLSAEDRYVALAYYALRDRALFQNMILDDSMIAERNK